MFSSPARTPRRSVRPRESTLPRGSASVFSDAPSLPAARGATPSVRSRLAVAPARRGSPASSAGETVRTVRERVEEERVSWSRDERHAVYALGDLPVEVQGLVKGADFIVQSVEGQIDLASGFALVSSPTVCAAWSFAKRTHSPTVYAFPPPVPTRTPHNSSPPPLASFFAGPNAGAGEPGLVLVSATGEIRFWESMSLALANVERYQVLEVPLGEDFVERLWKADASTFIITTTASSAFRLTIAPSGGRVVPTLHPLTRPGGMFGRASSVIFNGRDDRAGVSAVAQTTGGVYILAKRTLQKWALMPDGTAKLLQEFDLLESIGTSLFDDESAWQSGGISLELNDLVSVGPDRLAALVSYARYEHDRRTQNSHAVVLFENHTRANTVMISNIVHLSYVAHPDPRLLDLPRLYIPGGSTTAFIRFADAIVLASLSDTPYEDAIPLKDAVHNAFISIGSTSASTKQPSIVAMPATGGLLGIEVHAGAQNQALSAQAEATARLKSKMEQAVFFGDRSDNPLTFDLPPGFQGDLAAAAEAVSAEIVASSSPYMPPIFETRPQLMDRLARMKELMTFIHRNGALSLLSQSSRRRLSRDAEKVKAATDLWDYQNRLMDKLHTHSPGSLLADAIESLMVGKGIEDEDVVRGFFRTQVHNLDALLARVYALFQERARQGQDSTAWVLEANRIFITVLRTASQFREDEIATYQIDRLHPVDEPWTAADAIVDALDALFTATDRLVRDRTRALGSVIDEAPTAADAETRQAQVDQVGLKRQMTELAAALCSNMEDKLRAGAERQMDGGADPNDGLSLAERWAQLKPRVIRPLVDIDRVPEAYELAEHHSDFPTLVYLCHHPAAGTGPVQIQTYIERFGEEFAFVLYQWYIDNGHIHALLSQDEVYGALLTSFFASHAYPHLAWMHHLACGRYGDAAQALAGVEATTGELEGKHLVASLGKLAAVAETKKSDAPKAKSLLQHLDNELDLISVQDTLRDSIVARASAAGGGADAVVAAHAAGLAEKPAFTELLADCVGRLIAGDALGIEDLVDVLTLKDNAGDAELDYARALERLSMDSQLPEGRRQVALLSIWRRVFIRDDWAAITSTKGRSEEAQRDMQRQTAAYITLRAISENEDFPPNYILSPFTATQPPLAAELAARFPARPAAAIARLLDDHAREIATLDALVERGLDGWVREIGALAKADMEGDVEMA
ncbi:hypothetical protein Q5752_005074 [Cryptotrichosporon argae]